MNAIKRFFLIGSSLLAPVSAFAAACCGGGFASPSLILGDDQAQLTGSYSYTQVTDDVGTDSLWRKRTSKEVTETIRFEGAHLLSDRWQVGVSLPIVSRRRGTERSTGLGDSSFTLGYEALPDWDYSAWRPKGTVFAQITAPTGRSVNEAVETYQLDSRGRGFWAAGIGGVLAKAFGAFDVFASLDAHRSFAKSFSNSQMNGRLEPGFGGSGAIGTGWNPSALRLGASLSWTYEDAVSVTGAIPSAGASQRYATATVSAAYLISRELAATVSYADQTKFGSPSNTSLGRGVLLLVQRRWER